MQLPLPVPLSIYLWGRGDHHQLGSGDSRYIRMLEYFLRLSSIFGLSFTPNRDRNEPTLLDACPHENLVWTQLHCGGYYTAALTKNGDVYTWGENNYGQLGHGDQIFREIPTKVVSLNGLIIIKVVCGAYHTAALTDKGGLFTWYVHPSRNYYEN